MSDLFVETLVKRKNGASTFLIRFLLILVEAICVLSIPIFGTLGMTVAVLMGYVVYLLWTNTNIEFEYSFLNGEVTIDKIIGQRKRKRVYTFDLKQTEIVAPTDSEEIIRRSGKAGAEDFSSRTTEKTYSAIVNSDNGSIQVIFEPDQEMLDAMYHMRPNLVKIK